MKSFFFSLLWTMMCLFIVVSRQGSVLLSWIKCIPLVINHTGYVRKKCHRLVFQICSILTLVQNPGFKSLRYNLGYLFCFLQPNFIIRVEVIRHYCPTNAIINCGISSTLYFLFSVGKKVRKTTGVYGKGQVSIWVLWSRYVL